MSIKLVTKVPTCIEIKKIIQYRPTVGEFYWRTGYIHGRGKAGTMHRGNLIVKISGRYYLAAKLAVLYMIGDMPARVKFKDGNKLNLLFSNLEWC